MSNPRSPIVYENVLDIRFGELDSYGHLNAKHYFDLLSSSRMMYLERDMKIAVKSVVQRGIAFYATKVTQNFRRPIEGLAQVYVRSHVEDVRECRLIVPFEIRSALKDRLYCDGIAEFAIINLETKKPVEMPEWVGDLFFYSTGDVAANAG